MSSRRHSRVINVKQRSAYLAASASYRLISARRQHRALGARRHSPRASRLGIGVMARRIARLGISAARRNKSRRRSLSRK